MRLRTLLSALLCVLAVVPVFVSAGCFGGDRDQPVLIGGTGDPQTMKHISVGLNISGSRTRSGAVSVGYGPSRSYMTDPHDLRVLAHGPDGSELGVLWVADPRLVRVFDSSGGLFHEHAFTAPTASVTVFVPFLTSLSDVSAGYPGQPSATVDLTGPIRSFCNQRSTADDECQAWLKVH